MQQLLFGGAFFEAPEGNVPQGPARPCQLHLWRRPELDNNNNNVNTSNKVMTITRLRIVIVVIIRMIIVVTMVTVVEY